MKWLKRSAGLAAGLLLAAPMATGAEKLKVFILAGQSNMVVRDTQAAVFDVFESSTLGKTATPAEFAATSQPAKTLIQP